MILKIGTVECNIMLCKMCGFREGKRWRTVNLDNYGEIPLFLYHDHTLNRGCS